MSSFGFSQTMAGLVSTSPDSDNVTVLDGGTATHMGDGIWTVMQRDEYGATQSVVLERADLESMLAVG